MTLSQLRTFVVVADTESVRAAAQRLYVTQSAVSAAVAALQRDLGVELVARQGRGLRITEVGQRFAEYARTILGLVEEAEAMAQGEREPEHGRVRIGAVTTAAEHVLPPFLAAFRRRFPEAEVQVEVGNRERVWSQLIEHYIDLAIAGRPPDEQGLFVRGVRPNALVVVAAPDVARKVDVTQPGTLTWLLREHGSGTRATTEAYLEALEIDPPRLTLGSNGAVVAGAEVGLGVTLVSRDAVQRELSEGRLEQLLLPDTPLQRPWHAVTHRTTTATTELFVEHLGNGTDPATTPPFIPPDS